MKLIGQLATLTLADFWFTPSPGRYCVIDGGEQIPTARECPYCHDRLTTLTKGEFSRIVAIAEKREAEWDVIVQSVPSSHTVARCATCHIAFTFPC